MHGDGNQLGLGEAIAYVLGDIVGSGIFVSPGSILRHANSVGLSFIIWILGCLVAGMGCLIYVELGTKIRKSGCDYAYLQHAKWRPVAVTFLYVSCGLIYPSILAIQMMAFGEYIVQGLVDHVSLTPVNKELLKKLVGFMALWVVFYINLFSLKKFASRFQIVVTISKFVILAGIIVIGFYYLIFKESTGSFNKPFASTTDEPAEVILALYASLYSYNGWDILNFGTEEIKNPRSFEFGTLPIAGLCGLGLAALAYVAVNVAYFSVLTVDEFKSTDTAAVEFAKKTIGSFSYVVPFLIALLLLGNLNSTIFGCSRYVLAGAREKHFPSFLRLINVDSESPRAAIFVEVVVAMLLSFIGSLEQILAYMTFAMWTQRFIVQISLIYMRYLVSLALIVIPVIQNYKVAIYGTILILVGLSVYFIFVFRENKPAIFHKIDEVMVVFMQVLLNLEFDDPPKIE